MIRRLLILLLLFPVKIFAQSPEVFKPDSIRRVIKAMPITGTLRVDGLMNEPEWQLAKPESKFFQVEPYQGRDANFATEVRSLYNNRYLYIGIFSRDSLGRKAIRATDFKRDFDYRQHDLVTLAFDGFNDRRDAMSVAADPYGVQRDLLSFDDLYYDLDWDGLWRVRTSRTDSGWYAEFAIPWQTLRYPKSPDSLQNWGFNMYRNRRLTNEITAFSPFPRVFSVLRMAYAGELTNLRPPPPRTNIRIVPYVLGSYDHYKGYDPGVKPEQYNAKLGGEIKWAINTNSILDLTANTDFAQADVDQQVNNVTRFSVFFPEKRQFFLENASLFGFGISGFEDGSGGSMRYQPFFSRSIGLDSTGHLIPIVVGGRFVYRSTKRNFGAILMRQADLGNMPATNFFVGRYSENFGQQNRIGAMVTVKNNSVNTNIESTIDGFFRLGETQSLSTILTHTSNTRGGNPGFAGMAQYINSTLNYKYWLTASVVTKNFSPEMGFISRTDIIGAAPGINYYYRGKLLPAKKLIRAFEPGILPEVYFRASTGQLTEASLPIWPIWINFQSGAYFGYGLTPYYQRLLEPFQPLGINIDPGEYHFFRQEVWLSSDPSKFLSGSVDFRWGSYFNGNLQGADIKMQLAPLPNISLSAAFNRNHFEGVGNPLTSETVDLYILQARLALNPRLQLIGFYQRNSENNAQNYNIRLSWEYQPLSYVYLVYNHLGFDNFQAKRMSEDHAIVKISFMKQF